MRVKQRWLGIIILIILLFGLNFAVAAVDYGPYPEEEDIISDPAAYEGQQVFIFTDVKSVNQSISQLVILREDNPVVDVGLDGVTRRVEYRQEVVVNITDTPTAGRISEGSYIQIYGQLRDDSTTIDATRVVVDYQNTADYRYMYGSSILGGIISVVYFFKNWQINLRNGSFEPRDNE